MSERDPFDQELADLRAEVKRLKGDNNAVGMQLGDLDAMRYGNDALQAEVKRLNAVLVTTTAACETANWTLGSSRKQVAELREALAEKQRRIDYVIKENTELIGLLSERGWQRDEHN